MRRAVPFKLDEALPDLPAAARRRARGRGAGRPGAPLAGRAVRAGPGVAGRAARSGRHQHAQPDQPVPRSALDGAARNGGDAGLLNCTRNYFSLVIVRDGRLIFFRCKTFAIDEAPQHGPNGVLVREIASSLSYYREKLAGEAVGKIFVRTVVHAVRRDRRQARRPGRGRRGAARPAARTWSWARA